MAYNREYPYVDPNLYNDDWLLQKVKEVENSVLGYQEQIDSISAKLDKVESDLANINYNPLAARSFIIITDSYGAFGNWINELKTYFSAKTKFFEAWVSSGSGFTVGGNSFLDVFTSRISSISEPASITDIVVLGGYNDIANFNNIIGAMETFVASVRNFCPQAVIHVGQLSSSIVPSARQTINVGVAYNYELGCAVTACNYIRNCNLIMKNISFYDTDNIHPTIPATTVIGRYIREYIETGSINYREINIIDTIPSYGIKPDIYLDVQNDIATFYLYFTGLFSQEVVFSGVYQDVGQLVARVNNGILYGLRNGNEVAIWTYDTPILIYTEGDAGFKEYQGRVTVEYGNIYVQVYNVDQSGGAQAVTANAITIPYGTNVLPSSYL